MSQFQGSKSRVRCIDCSRLDGNTCLSGRGTVAPRKKRMCTQYQFKGEYVNRTSIEAVYVPPVDKKTEKMIKKLIRLGIMPQGGAGQVALAQDGTPIQQKQIQVPGTTATAKLLQLQQSPSIETTGGAIDGVPTSPVAPEQG